MAIWPANLPTLTQANNYTEIPGEHAIRTKMDEGPAKTRRLSNPMPDTIQFQQIYTITETQTMDTFYVTTLSGGALSFDDTHPRTGAAATFRFVTRPQYVHVGGGNFQCSIELEVLP